MPYDVGDLVPLSLDVGPADTSTVASVAVTRPDGTLVDPPPMPDASGDRTGWTARVLADRPGVWTATWTVVGTGAGVERDRFSVRPTPGSAQAPVPSSDAFAGYARESYVAGLVDTEQDARVAGDAALAALLAAEETVRDAADDALGDRITGETTARGTADTALGERITTEKTARETADTALGQRVTDEATARANADDALAQSRAPRLLPTAAGTRSGTYDPARSVYLPSTAGTALRRLRAKLAAAAAGGTVHLVAVGDSKTAGTGPGTASSWPAQLRTLLSRAGVPAAGTGVCLAQWAPLDASLDPRWAATGTWGAGTSWAQASTVGATLTFTSDQPGTVVDVWFYNNSAAFSVSIDGGAPVPVARTGANTVGRYQVTGLANTLHTVAITVTAAAAVYLIGVDVHQPTGLMIHNVGFPGMPSTGASNFDFPNVGYALRGMFPSPDVLVAALGANDAPWGVSQTQTRDAVTATLAGYGNPPALLVVETHTANTTAADWAVRQGYHYDVADAQGVPLLDLADRWGPAEGAYTLGVLGVDRLHETAAGHADVARAVAGVLDPHGTRTSGVSAEVHVRASNPGMTRPGLWLQTGIGPGGTGMTLWIEDGS